MERPIRRFTNTPVGSVPLVLGRLGWRDRLGAVKVRFGFRRMRYRIGPGLYCLGNLSPESPVFISANYKLSFDNLRQGLDGLDAWILVLDTKGINVWCAAGKGTFGTDEVVRRVEETNLAALVSHRTLFLPQLGAPGVAAHEVTRRTRFKVIYGPVRASDIKEFVKAGMKATENMRRVRFDFRDRLVLTLMEMTNPFKYAALISLALWVLDMLGWRVFSWRAIYPYLGAILAGTVVVPALLPYIPGRAFAWKGWVVGMIWVVGVNIHRGLIFSPSPRWGQAALHSLLLPAISALLAMGFTGSSTYTSLSGVLQEMKYAVPAIFLSAGLGLAFLAVGLIRGF
ncbi:MAG: mercury methylation corrinoid protein HgcA [Acidobacteriota bacterium]